jgi:hypothetical protein
MAPAVFACFTWNIRLGGARRLASTNPTVGKCVRPAHRAQGPLVSQLTDGVGGRD